tara:strand:- start:1976 stop:3748 length:1773 start_codon:yes stop_codon:yes gene_type:complete
MATETLVSPGVLLQESDLSFTAPGTDPSGLAIIGPAVQGPIEVPTVIKNFNQFKSVFGTAFESASQGYEYFTSIAARNYFANGGSNALITRVVSASSTWDYAGNTHISASAKGGTQPFTLETIGKGEIYNNAINTTTIEEFAGGILKTGSADNFRWEVTSVNNKAGTFTLVIRRGDDKASKPLILEQFTNLSLDPLNSNYVAKAIGDQRRVKSAAGDSIEIQGEFPNKSQYVRISSVNLPTYEYSTNNLVGTDGGGTSYSASLPTAQSGAFFGGAGSNIPTHVGGNYGKDAGNGATDTGANNIQGLSLADYTDAFKILKNKEEFKFKTLIVPGLNQENHGSTISTIISNTEVRGDNLFVLDPVKHGTTVISTVKTEGEELDTSFAASYWPWVQVASPELGRNINCPASVVIPGVYAQTDSVAAPWFAPAGLNRGKLRKVSKTELKLSKAQRDDLYVSKINPLATFPGQGVVVFGQKTLQQASSALDRVNVRRLLLDVKDVINGFARNIVFEQNTEATRETFVKQVTPYLDSLVQRSGLYAFKVKMDGELNTSDIIDANQLVGQVFLQPTKTAEFILLDFILTPTGASFTD